MPQKQKRRKKKYKEPFIKTTDQTFGLESTTHKNIIQRVYYIALEIVSQKLTLISEFVNTVPLEKRNELDMTQTKVF